MQERPDYSKFIERLKMSEDETRVESTKKRHSKKYRTARENLNHLVDEDSFLEFGQFAVAAATHKERKGRSHSQYKCGRGYYWVLQNKFRYIKKNEY
jgi:acetyl-CoA carboxylase carboxyltransferase component